MESLRYRPLRKSDLGRDYYPVKCSYQDSECASHGYELALLDHICQEQGWTLWVLQDPVFDLPKVWASRSSDATPGAGADTEILRDGSRVETHQVEIDGKWLDVTKPDIFHYTATSGPGDKGSWYTWTLLEHFGEGFLPYDQY